MSIFCCFSKEVHGTSLAVQWLRLCASGPGGAGSLPGLGTKILQDAWQKKRKKEKEFLELNKNKNVTYQLKKKKELK